MKLFLGVCVVLILLGGVWFGFQEAPRGESGVISEESEIQVDSNGVYEENRENEIRTPSRFSQNIEVYDGISVPENATILDVSGRGLQGSLRAEVRHLSQLKILDVSRNNFTGLPAEVGQLSQLEVLNLSYNPFTGLPYELGNLSQLKTLDLRGTQYSEADLAVIRESLPSTTEILTD